MPTTPVTAPYGYVRGAGKQQRWHIAAGPGSTATLTACGRAVFAVERTSFGPEAVCATCLRVSES